MTGYSNAREVTETEPAWRHVKGGYKVQVTAIIANGDDTIVVSEQTARILGKGNRAIIDAVKHNKSLQYGVAKSGL